jgi:hypothetical protein
VRVYVWRWKYFRPQWKVERVIRNSISLTLGKTVFHLQWKPRHRPMDLDEFLKWQEHTLRLQGKR